MSVHVSHVSVQAETRGPAYTPACMYATSHTCRLRLSIWDSVHHISHASSTFYHTLLCPCSLMPVRCTRGLNRQRCLSARSSMHAARAHCCGRTRSDWRSRRVHMRQSRSLCRKRSLSWGCEVPVGGRVAMWPCGHVAAWQL